MARQPEQALPITATQCGVTAALSALWAVADGFGVAPLAADQGGWLLSEGASHERCSPIDHPPPTSSSILLLLSKLILGVRTYRANTVLIPC